VTFLDVLRKASSGPYCSVNDWDMKVIPSKVSAILREHGLEKTCDVQNPINADDNLAHSYFEAGWDLAIETGFLCMDTQRIIEIQEEELRHSLRECSTKVHLGAYGTTDQVVVSHRNPEDSCAILNIGGPLGNTTTEDMNMLLAMTAAQYREVDALVGGVPTTCYGLPIKGGEAIDYLAGILFIRNMREAARRANRPGMPLGVAGPCGTPIGHAAALSEVQPGDFSAIPGISELKIDDSCLIRVAMSLHRGVVTKVFHHPMIGGYAGGPEGCAIMRIACNLLMVPIYQTAWIDSVCTDMRFGGSNTSREAIWSNSVACQALAANVRHVIGGYSRPVAGPCTHMLLYESAVAALSETVSGASSLYGPNVQIAQPDYYSGLEAKFSGELTRALCKAKFRQRDANDIANKLIPKYEKSLRNPPRGKRLQECVDPSTLKPSGDWLAIYHEVRKELLDLGAPLEL